MGNSGYGSPAREPWSEQQTTTYETAWRAWTDAQWARLEPLLPMGKKPGRPPTWTRQQLIDGVRFRTRTGVPWRDVPERYGPWARVYDLFRCWQRDGTWRRIFAQLQAQADAKELGP
ncbi:transposase [Streptomyces sp. NPDC093064]|uniref:transposase n=1 Tax=Streptomyces sp. NPDC093064 TaxID=3366020 RepID=UPI003817054B